MLHINVHALIDKYFKFVFIITSCQKPTYYGTYTKNYILYKKKNKRRGKNHKICINRKLVYKISKNVYVSFFERR